MPLKVFTLIHCNLLTPQGNIKSGRRYLGQRWLIKHFTLLPPGTKPTPEQMLVYHEWGSGITLLEDIGN